MLILIVIYLNGIISSLTEIIFNLFGVHHLAQNTVLQKQPEYETLNMLIVLY